MLHRLLHGVQRLHVVVGMPKEGKDLILFLTVVAQLALSVPGWAHADCPAGQDTVRLRCGWVEVAEDRSRAGGRRIRLFVMRKDPVVQTGRPRTDPIVFLDGGPGRAAHADAWWAELVLGSLVDTHRLVILDQRGTGNSAPLDCDLWAERRTTDRRYPVAAVRRCREELAPKAALDRYATKDAVMDLEAVRRALGVELLNLYGISYGARVAAGYAVLFPARVRSMVLHSPGAFAGWPDVPRHASLRVFERAMRGQPHGAVDAALRRLADSPLQVPFARASRTDTARVGPRVGAWLVRDLLNDPVAWEGLRPLMRSFHDRSASASIAIALEDFARGESGRSVGVHIGIICSEDIPARPPPIAEDWISVPLEEFAELCREWPRAQLPRWWGRAAPSNIPTLVISGRWDPVTPADSAVAFARRAGGMHSLVVEGGGHGGTWECAIRAVEKFVLAGSVVGLPGTCR
jgi:pimeloyl-ACP methyl ester carboxylesterase